MASSTQILMTVDALIMTNLHVYVVRQMNPALKSFMRRNNLSDVRDLLSIYEKKYVDDAPLLVL